MPINSEGELLLSGTRETAFRHAGSTFVAAKAPSLERRVKVLRRAQPFSIDEKCKPLKRRGTEETEEFFGFMPLIPLFPPFLCVSVLHLNATTLCQD
jgi:hypothetical protein